MGGRARLASSLVMLSLAYSCSGPTGPDPPPPPPGPGEVFVGAGDIGWCGLEGSRLTAALLDGIPGTVFTAGDNAYPLGSRDDYARCYEPSWGRHKSRTRPTPGNHDYETPDAAGYFEYFGASAGPTGVGYYSYPLGSWRVYALNSEISAFPGSPQLEWLRAELASHHSFCALAYFHTPVFGSGTNGSNPHMQAAWREMYAAGLDVIVSAHNHGYERFAPQDPDGRRDSARGIRQFVVGTGGAPLTGFPFSRPNSEVTASAWGVLKLTLRPDRYDWEFVPAPTSSFSDFGSESCH
jgi:calcineurin-like phosphoesterase family protein